MAATSARSRSTWVLVAVCTIVAGVLGGVVGGAIDKPSSTGSGPTASGTATGTGGTATACQVSDVASKDLPSVVTISAKGTDSAGTGSGEVIRSGGYVLTNNHVVTPALDGGALSVQFSDGTTAAATLVGRDPLTDIAVIKVARTGLPAIPVGKSGSLIVGQPVVVLGAPLGLYSTVTSGIVSALDRTIAVPGENQRSALLIDAIQTDAAINPGNSGGALVDCSGHFVGVPSAGATIPASASSPASSGSIGLGFAIPADLALAEAAEIISTGKVAHSYAGFEATPLSAETAASDGSSRGLAVTGVDASGPAAAAGLRTGDIVTTIDGQPAATTDQIVSLLLTKKPGDKISLGYTRAGQAATTTLTLAAEPQ